MERLTKYICGHAHGAEGLRDDNLTGNYCRGEFEATAIVDRLAAIEDILGDEYDLDRLRELGQADREGRVVVLPCKIGDKVYWIIDKRIYECYFDLSAVQCFGKTVFLTREEATAALRREQDE